MAFEARPVAQTSKIAARLLPLVATLLGCGPKRDVATDSSGVVDSSAVAIDTSVRPQPAGVPWEDARRRGVDFRAIGQEPGWMLEIDHEKSLFLLADYGEKKVTMPAPAPRDSGGVVIYEAKTDTNRLTVIVREAVCHDAMSGEEMTHTVTLNLDGTEYRGCGRSLRAGARS